MAGKIRVGFIGAGGISLGHYHRLLATKKVQLVALNEPSVRALRQFHAHCPGTDALPVYNDYKDMLKHETLDAVVVQSPHSVHYEQIRAALAKGLHVLSEKPLVGTIQHAKALIAQANKAQRILMISYQRHFDPCFRYMRAQIQKGALGDIQFVQAILSQEWLRATRGTWRQDPALSDGGQIHDSGSHLVDILMWVTGMKVREVLSFQENFNTKVDINSALSLRFENGALGNLSIIGNAPCWYEDHTIVGSKGAFYLRQGIGLMQQDAVGKQVTVKLPKYTKDPDSNFVDSILGKDEPQTPPECGLRTIEVTEAAWKSAVLGKPVRVR